MQNARVNKLEGIEGQDSNNIVWSGDFNAHSTLWGSDKTDNNGQVLKELMEGRNVICLNDGLEFMLIQEKSQYLILHRYLTTWHQCVISVYIKKEL